MQPKRHHYVSQFYLAGWADGGAKTGKLTVTEVKTGKQRPGTPKGEANVKDLYTIESREDPLIVETEFAKMEDKVAPVIRKIAENQALPSDLGEMDILLSWIALQRQKVLRMREVYEKFYDDLGRMMMKVATQSDAVFESSARQDGVAVASRVIVI